jgi:hypothetical protein
VDKWNFLHKLKGLPAFQAAEQGLRLAGTETGQKNGGGQVAWFRTFDPVDIHGLVHRAGLRRGRRRDFGQVGGLTGVEKFLCCEPAGRSAIGLSSLSVEACSRSRGHLPGASPSGVEKFFFGEAAIFRKLVRFTTKSLFTE